MAGEAPLSAGLPVVSVPSASPGIDNVGTAAARPHNPTEDLPSWALRSVPASRGGGGVFFLKSERRDVTNTGRAGGFFERQSATDRVEHNSDDELYDEFGRKKRKKTTSTAGPASKTGRKQASAGAVKEQQQDVGEASAVNSRVALPEVACAMAPPISEPQNIFVAASEFGMSTGHNATFSGVAASVGMALCPAGERVSNGVPFGTHANCEVASTVPGLATERHAWPSWEDAPGSAVGNACWDGRGNGNGNSWNTSASSWGSLAGNGWSETGTVWATSAGVCGPVAWGAPDAGWAEAPTWQSTSAWDQLGWSGS